MRKLIFLSSQNVDVLVINNEGSDPIRHCIPNAVSFSVLPVVGVIPVILSFSFILSTLVHIIRFKRIQDVIIFSIIDTLKPKVLITNVDNSNLMGIIHNEFPNKLTISVQNGFRSGPKYAGGSYSKYPVSIFYGFGEHEGIMMKKLGINNYKYVPSGSLRFGLFKKRFSENLKKEFDLCFISQFNVDVLNPQIKILMDNGDKVFLSLIRLCETIGFSLSIAMRSESSSKNYLKEINHFNSLDPNAIAKIIPNNMINCEGYKTAAKSNILISVNSTLAFEMFGEGHKALFTSNANDYNCSDLWDTYENFNKLPSMNLIEKLSFEEISHKLKFLINIDEEEYIEKTEKSRQYYMNHIDTMPTHELIQTKITEFIS